MKRYTLKKPHLTVINAKKVVDFIFVFSLVVIGLDNLGIPSSINHLLEIAILLLNYFIFKAIKKVLKASEMKWFSIWCGCYFFLLILGDILNLVKPQLAIWGIFSTLKFYAYFIGCIIGLKTIDVEKHFRFLYYLQVINLIISLYQYVILGYDGDHVGGIFGVSAGANAYTNIFLFIICTHSLTNFICNGKNKGWTLFINLSSLLIAVLAEIKFFYIEFIIIALMIFLLSKPSVRKTVAIVVTIVAVVVGLQLMKVIIPDSYKIMTNLQLLDEYSTGEMWGYHINRAVAFSSINRLWFHNNVLKNLFGVGVGNADRGPFKLLVSDFYKVYGGYHYDYFTHEKIFLETGYLGYGLWLAFFILLFIYAQKSRSKYKQYLQYVIFTQIICVLAIINSWYNQGTIVESAYYLYFSLASLPIYIKYENSK